jgi:hypothetical protein
LHDSSKRVHGPFIFYYVIDVVLVNIYINNKIITRNKTNHFLIRL